jgi:regulator of PEP synthase PpsR (kinase-PPPase family)
VKSPNLGKTGEIMTRPQRPSIYFNVHLVSDSTGETLNAIQRAACAQFENVQALEHNYYLVRSERQLERVMREIEAAPGVVWYTISDEGLRGRLESFCREKGVPTLPVLDASIAMLSRHLGISANQKVAGQHALDEDYFERMEAINFTLAHDDGQNVESLTGADVILLGVSRTSKTPTCVYLANRKVRAGNIPLVPGVPLPAHIERMGDKGPMIVGLKISAERLVQIRRARLISLNEDEHTIYADEDAVRDEVTQANRLFQRNKWRTIDVSRRSVEETAAAILNLLNERRGQL